MTDANFSTRPVTRDQVELALKLFLSSQEPGFPVMMIHPDGTMEQEIVLSMEGSDNVQGFMLQLAVVTSEEANVIVGNEVIINKEAIIETFYGYATKLLETEGKEGWFTLTLDFKPDLFSALMTDPSLGLI